jgi:hypothetical protein
MNSRKAIASNDLTLLFLITIIIISVWTFIIQMPLSSLFGEGDTFALFAHYSEMLRTGPLASNYIYSNTRIGGVAVGPVDTAIYHQLFSSLGFHPMLAINFSVIASQSLVSFFCIKILHLFQNKIKTDFVVSFFLLILFAFNPAIAWRLVFGHLNLVWGLLWGLAIIYLTLGNLRNKLSITGVLCSVAVFCNSLQCINLAQPILYVCLIFTFFILLYIKEVLSFYKKNGKQWLLLSLLIGAALFYSIVNIANTISYLPFLGRSVSDSLIYTYNVETLNDFFSSLFYSYKTVNTRRSFYFLHETDLGYGVLPILFLALICREYKKKWLWAVACVFLFGIFLSANIPIFSDTLLTIIPLLRSFRCPSRFFFPINYILLMILGWYALHSDIAKEKKKVIFSFLGFVTTILLFVTLEIQIDYLTLVFIGIFIFLFTCRLNLVKEYALLMLSILSVMNILGFKEKVPEESYSIEQYQRSEELIRNVTGFSTKLLEHNSAIIHSPFQLNQGAVYNFSGMDGYVYPSRNFSQFYRLLNPHVGELNLSFIINSANPGYHIFSKIFNITKELRMEGNKLFLAKIQNNAPIILADHIDYTDDPKIIISGLEKNDGTIFVENKYKENLKANKICNEVSILNQNSSSVKLKIRNTGRCLIQLATQYSIFLKAMGNNKNFEVIPVNWISTGIIIDDYEGEITVEVTPRISGEILYKIIAILLVAIFIFIKREKMNI